MGSKCEMLENSRVRLEIEIPAGALEQEMQKAFQKTGYKYDVPGFRKGRAPRKLIEARYGEKVFFDDALDALFSEEYSRAIEEHVLEPVERPKVEILKMDEGKDLVIAAEVTVKPEVKLGAYRGLEAEKIEYAVTDDDVTKEIERMRDRAARFVESTAPVKSSDRIVLDYSGSVDGISFEGGTAEEKTLDIGSGTFIPGFEEQLIGMEKGESKAIKVRFPGDYRSEGLRGRDAVFEAAVKDIKEKQLPELDDEFAKDVSEFDTLEELKADIKKHMQETADRSARDYLEEILVKKAVDAASVEIPEVMVENKLEYMLRRLEFDMHMQGLTLEKYFEYTKTDSEGFKKQYRSEAYDRVKARLVLEAVSKAENIQPSEEEVEAEIKKHAEEAGKEHEKYRASLTEDDLEYIREQIAVSQAIVLLLENAIFVQPKGKKKEKRKVAAEGPNGG